MPRQQGAPDARVTAAPTSFFNRVSAAAAQAKERASKAAKEIAANANKRTNQAGSPAAGASALETSILSGGGLDEDDRVAQPANMLNHGLSTPPPAAPPLQNEQSEDDLARALRESLQLAEDEFLTQPSSAAVSVPADVASTAVISLRSGACVSRRASVFVSTLSSHPLPQQKCARPGPLPSEYAHSPPTAPTPSAVLPRMELRRLRVSLPLRTAQVAVRSPSAQRWPGTSDGNG